MARPSDSWNIRAVLREADPQHKARCKKLAKLLIPVIRAKAKELGYAIGVHGSLQYDIDLIAVPWTSKAIGAVRLAQEIQEEIRRVHGIAEIIDKIGSSNPAYFDWGCMAFKPHGRFTWAFHLGGGPYIDLSVMPRKKKPGTSGEKGRA